MIQPKPTLGTRAIDRIEQNYAEVRAGKYDMRLAAIRAIENPVGRATEERLVHLIQRFPDAFGKMLGVDLPTNHRFAGSTGEFTMLTNTATDRTTRVHRHSVRLSSAGRQALVETFEYEHALVNKYMGPFVVNQSVRRTSHPFRHGQRAVLMSHAAIRGADPQIFGSQQPSVDSEALTIATSVLANSGDFRELGKRGLSLWNREGLLIDISAPQGVLIREDHSLIVSNGLPIQNPTTGDARRILGELNLLVHATN